MAGRLLSMRILGIDYGDKKIGLAFGDSSVKVAVPLDVILNTGEATIRELAKRVKAEDIELIVVGVPLSPNTTKQLDKTRAFISLLKAAVTVPIVEEDESFTTAESRRLMAEEDAGAEEDALAAMLIVQQHLNNLVI